MSGAGIRVDSREAERALEELAGDVSAMPETWHDVGDALLAGVRQRTPVRSGELAASWEARGEADRAAITSSLPYAIVLEYGSEARGIDGVHMVADTLAASDAVILEELEDAIARQARRIGFEVRR